MSDTRKNTVILSNDSLPVESLATFVNASNEATVTSSDDVGTSSSEGTDCALLELTTPSSEGSDFDFEGLEVIEGVPVDSDEDWIAVSPNPHAHRPSSLLSSRTVSDASMQNSNAPLIVSSPHVALPSPPPTPPSLTSQARSSDTGCETD